MMRDPPLELQRHASGQWQPLEGGRVNQLWRVRDGNRDLVVKLYAREGHSPLYANDPHTELTVLQALEGTGIAPEGARLLMTSAGPCLIYEHLPGTPWRQNPAPVAELLGRLHALPPPRLPQIIQAWDEDILAGCTGPEADQLRALRPQASAVSSPVALVHRDPVPGNIIVDNGTLRLIDWQCPALGDPCEDMVTFLSPAMQFLYRGAPLSIGEEAAFLAAYPHKETLARLPHLRPMLHWRIAAHCLWRAHRGHADYATALGLELAALTESSRSKPPAP